MAFSDATAEGLFRDKASPVSHWAADNQILSELPEKIVIERLLLELGKHMLNSPEYEKVWSSLKSSLNIEDEFEPVEDLDQTYVRELQDEYLHLSEIKHACVLPGRLANATMADGSKWRVSVRASFTACVLEDQNATTKIWLNFGATPKFDERKQVDQRNVASILNEFEKAANKSNNSLQAAYKDAVNLLLEGINNYPSKPPKNEWEDIEGKVIVNFTDNDHASMKAFLLSMLSDNWGNKNKKAYLAAEGKEEFREFVSNQIADFSDFEEGIIPAVDTPDAIGFMYKCMNETIGYTKVMGFARRPYELSPISDDNDELKSIGIYSQSAARPLSAHIANKIANSLT